MNREKEESIASLWKNAKLKATFEFVKASPSLPKIENILAATWAAKKVTVQERKNPDRTDK